MKRNQPYILSVAADSDLVNLLIYGLTNFGAYEVAEYEEGLESVLRMVGENPDLRPLDFEMNPPVRWFPYRQHIIVWEITEEGIALVLRIRHHSEAWHDASV